MHYTQCCVLCSQKHHKKVFCFFFLKNTEQKDKTAGGKCVKIYSFILLNKLHQWLLASRTCSPHLPWSSSTELKKRTSDMSYSENIVNLIPDQTASLSYSYSVLDVGLTLIVILSWPFMCSPGKHRTLHETGEFSCRCREQALRDLQPKWNVEECVCAISSIGLAVLFQHSAPTAADWQLHLSTLLWSLMHMQPAALIKKMSRSTSEPISHHRKV